MTKILLSLVLSLACASCACGSGYSEGERTGVIVKISRKGLFCKSFEGQLNLGSASVDSNGVMAPTVWDFTVPDGRADLVSKLEEFQRGSKRATIQYSQWLSPPICNGSDYEVVGVK